MINPIFDIKISREQRLHIESVATYSQLVERLLATETPTKHARLKRLTTRAWARVQRRQAAFERLLGVRS